MLFVLMTMLLDSGAAPVGLTSISAAVNGTKLSIQCSFEASDTTPILVWPRKNEWHNPCRQATDLCCMRDLLLDYRNDELEKQQGPRCMQGLTGNLITGSREGVAMQGVRNFTALVPLDTPFVAMLFVHMNPFYVFDGAQMFSIRQNGSVEIRAMLHSNPCYNVQVPGKPFGVCMHCNNALGPNARFVWTPTWYVDYVCEWQCNDGFQLDSNLLNPQCAPASGIPLQSTIIIACCVVVAVLLCLLCCRAQTPTPPPEAPEAPAKITEIIQFRENTITPMHIRVKMH